MPGEAAGEVETVASGIFHNDVAASLFLQRVQKEIQFPAGSGADAETPYEAPGSGFDRFIQFPYDDGLFICVIVHDEQAG